MTALTVPDVLRRAEQVIAERGWTRGRYERRGRVCMVRAIDIACMNDGVLEPKLLFACYFAVGEVIGPTLSVSCWNDKPGRKKAEVRAALLAAAQRAEAGT